jgi:hypothetical protein
MRSSMAVGEVVHIQPDDLAFVGDEYRESFFMTEHQVERLVGFLQRALADVMIAKDGLRHGGHRFLDAAAAADLQKEIGEGQVRERRMQPAVRPRAVHREARLTPNSRRRPSSTVGIAHRNRC